MRQRARPTLPGRRRTCHGSLSAALQLLLVQQPLWEPRSGAKTHDETVAYGSRGIRVASEPTVGRDGLSSGRRRATRRDSNRGRGIGRLDETMSPVARGRVLSRFMIYNAHATSSNLK